MDFRHIFYIPTPDDLNSLEFSAFHRWLILHPRFLTRLVKRKSASREFKCGFFMYRGITFFEIVWLKNLECCEFLLSLPRKKV